ncbi:hypothetical protein YC2023_083636 [Brassica napus]
MNINLRTAILLSYGLPRRMVSSGEILCQEIILLKSKPARFSSNYWNSCVIYANTPADGLSKLQDSILELKPRRIITEPFKHTILGGLFSFEILGGWRRLCVLRKSSPDLFV